MCEQLTKVFKLNLNIILENIEWNGNVYVSLITDGYYAETEIYYRII